MTKIFTISQIVISLLFSLLVLIQNKEGGLGSVFGGREGFKATRRGAEQVIEWATIIFAFLFLANSFAFVLI